MGPLMAERGNERISHQTMPVDFAAMGRVHNIFSVDVEDWFHILNLDGGPGPDEWAGLESRVVNAHGRLLDAFDEAGATVTCFFLGWVAEHCPELVKETHRRGHEIASHGHYHQLVFDQRREEFAADIKRSKTVLEDLIGEPVLGYRAPGFSITASTPWALEEIAAAGYLYDSSIFPADHGHGGVLDAQLEPHLIKTPAGTLVEFPITVAPVFGQRVCFFGGGYLRLFPYVLIRHLAKMVNHDGRPVIYYVHPREVDPEHPRLKMTLLRKFKSYVNLRSTLPKIRRIIADKKIGTFRDWLTPRQAGLP
jgi:polysaccharide deacetylase family protein (PEP-CTERM system associated)